MGYHCPAGARNREEPECSLFPSFYHLAKVQMGYSEEFWPVLVEAKPLGGRGRRASGWIERAAAPTGYSCGQAAFCLRGARTRTIVVNSEGLVYGKSEGVEVLL